MGIFELLFVVLIVIAGYKNYQRQDYWLDQQIGKLIKWVKQRLTQK
jgi:hypothetical protein